MTNNVYQKSFAFDVETFATIDCDECGQEITETFPILVETFTDYRRACRNDAAIVCEDCADNGRDLIAMAESCNGCGETIVDGFAGLDFDSIYPTIGGIKYAKCANGHSYIDDYCMSCGDDMTQCNDCGEYVHCDDRHYCESCDTETCESCRHDCDDNEDNEDGRTLASITLRESMNIDGTPGVFIISTRAFGVEYETAGGDRGSACADFRDIGNLIGSMHGEHCGDEYVSLPRRGAFGEAGILQALSVLAEHGYSPIGTDSGTHFHLDMTNENDAARNKALAALRIAEPYLFAAADIRRTAQSNWARPTRTEYRTTVADMLDKANKGEALSTYDQQSRYSAINSHALNAHGTIEIRVLDGTDDSLRLTHAIAFAAGIVDWAVGADCAEISAFIGDPAALLWNVARAGFFTVDTLNYLTHRRLALQTELRDRGIRENGNDEGNDKAITNADDRDLCTCGCGIRMGTARRY